MRLLNTTQTAELLGVEKNTLEVWRIRGQGPSYCKLNNRLVRYSEDDIRAYVNRNRRSLTFESDPPS